MAFLFSRSICKCHSYFRLVSDVERRMSNEWPMFVLQSLAVVTLVGTLFIRGPGD
jgi:hypothetical protein